MSPFFVLAQNPSFLYLLPSKDKIDLTSSGPNPPFPSSKKHLVGEASMGAMKTPGRIQMPLIRLGHRSPKLEGQGSLGRESRATS